MGPGFRIVLIASFGAAVAPSIVAQQESWVGESVVYTKPHKEIKFGDAVNGKQIDFVFSGLMPIKVRAEKGGRLRIHDGYHEGWVDKTSFVLSGDAPAYFDRRVQANPKDIFALYMRGAAWSDKGEFDKAIKDFGECIRLDPTQAAYFNCRGVAWNDKEDYDKAIADFNEAIRLDPNYGLAYNSRGIAWSEKKNNDKAIADFNDAIRLGTNDAWVYNNRGNAWTNKKNYDKAVADFTEAIRLDRNYAKAYRNRGIAWHEKRIYDKAIADYVEAFRLDSSNRDVLNAAAWLLATCSDAKVRNGKKAMELALKGAAIDKSADTMDIVAAAYAETGDFAEAVRWQDKALQADKDNPGYRRRMELYKKKQPCREDQR